MAAVSLSDPTLLNSFLKLSCNLGQSNTERRGFLGDIICNLTLSSSDQAVLINLINSYLGELD
jgi:hypothetical protein